MSELNEKVRKSIERLKAFEPKDEPYYLAFSGGKDSLPGQMAFEDMEEYE